MRVLHLTTEFPPVIYGGLGTAVGGWVTASARAGMTMGVLLVEGPLVREKPQSSPSYGGARGHLPTREQELEGGQRAVVDRDGIQFFRASWERAVDTGLRLARLWVPDVVHLHTAMVWQVGRAIQTHTALPVVYHVHSVDRAEYELGDEPAPWLAHSQAQEEAIAAAARLIALSHAEAALLASYYPQSTERIRVVGNGIDCPADRPVTRGAEAPPLVLYSGRLVERKGIRELLNALPRVAAVAPGTRFVIAGGPPPLTGAQLASQWHTRDSAEISPEVVFTGWLSSAELSTWYAAADILVVPSRYEPFGMVILEGMRHGLAIVASAVGGPAEILEHGRTGLLVPPRDVDALAHAITTLVCDREQRERLGRAAEHEVRRRWAWPNRVAAMHTIYQELLTQSRGTPPDHEPARRPATDRASPSLRPVERKVVIRGFDPATDQDLGGLRA